MADTQAGPGVLSGPGWQPDILSVGPLSLPVPAATGPGASSLWRPSPSQSCIQCPGSTPMLHPEISPTLPPAQPIMEKNQISLKAIDFPPNLLRVHFEASQYYYWAPTFSPSTTIASSGKLRSTGLAGPREGARAAGAVCWGPQPTPALPRG